MRKIRLVLLLALLTLFLFGFLFKKEPSPRLSTSYDHDPIPAQFEDKSLFLSPIKQVKDNPSNEVITGITVPHHLLATDLISRAFNFTSRGRYSQILLLSPDHFNLGDSYISTTRRNFSTVFGELETDSNAVQELEKLGFVHEQSFFYREHGLQAELPFIKYYFPDAKIIILTFKETTPKEQLDQVASELKKVLKRDSLIVQSTDFSHYLTPEDAVLHDQQTIKILKKQDPEQLFTLNQPDNLDSIASQYIQMRLQNEFYNSRFFLLANKNSQDYTKERVDSSTSYIVQAYSKAELSDRDSTLIFVGDIMLSRSVGEIMERKNDYNFPFSKISDFLKSVDLTFGNLEGPISDRGTQVGSMYSFRDNPKVVEGLKNAGFDVLSIANNHIWDYGKDAFLDTLNHLKDSGITPIGGGLNFKEAHGGAMKEINGTKLIFLGYTDLLPRSVSAGPNSAGVSYLDLDQMAEDIKEAKNKADIVIVSFHWGQEYQTQHSAGQQQIAKTAIDSGSSLVIGHHPHVVQEVEQYKNGWIAYSMGNFVFDQNFSKETTQGLALKVKISDGKIVSIDKQPIIISNAFQSELLNQ